MIVKGKALGGIGTLPCKLRLSYSGICPDFLLRERCGTAAGCRGTSELLRPAVRP